MFTVRRLLSATAVAVAAFAALPVPAQAAPAPAAQAPAAQAPAAQAQAAQAAPLTLTVHDMGVSEAGKIGDLHLTSGAGAPSLLTEVRIVLDVSDIDGFATAYVPSYSDGELKPSPSCQTENTVVTCSSGPVYANTGWLLPRLFVKVDKGAKIGASGTLEVTLKSKEAAPVKTEATVTVAEDVDLAAGPDHPVTTVEPGSPVEQPILIRNTGTKPVAGAAVEFIYADQGLVATPQFSNCGYADSRSVLFCKFDEELAAGTTYRIAAPVFQVRGAAPAGGEYFYAHLWTTRDDADDLGAGWYDGEQVTPGSGAVLHLEPVPATAALRSKTTDSNVANNIAFGYVKTPAAPSASASAPASHPGTATATAAGAGGAGSGGGGLPITGPDIAGAAGAGVVLLVAGAVLFVVARRRRTSFTA